MRNWAKRSEDCLKFQEHSFVKEVGTHNDDCDVCNYHNEHIIRAADTREDYKLDAKRVNNKDEAIFSVDLQKVIMLPRLPGVKSVAFTKRIIAYNETFAPLGDKKKVHGKKAIPSAMTWNEAEGGRSTQEICSTYIKFWDGEENRDVSNVTLWVDNCSSQNKCWYLYTSLCGAVNNNQKDTLQSITLKYFERGHSFMSADSYHHLVEKEMNTAKNVYDYRDFINVLEVHGKAILMKSADFIDFPRGVSEHSKFTKDKPMLADIRVAKFVRGSTKLFWKDSYKGEFKSARFLQKKSFLKELVKVTINFHQCIQMEPEGFLFQGVRILLKSCVR